MGKASRNKRERAQRSALDPHAKLHKASELIGYLYGAYADCAAAAAFLVLTGKELGYTLTARSVSVLAREPSTGDIAYMGPRASSLFTEADRSRAENHRQGNDDTGHMVVVADDPSVLIDPNLGQLRSLGMKAPDAIVLNIEAAHPESGQWVAKLEDLDVIYLPDDNEALWDRHNNALVGMQSDAHRLAQLIAGGATVEAIKKQIHRRN